MSKKLTQEEAEQIFIDGGGTFDDVYIDSNKIYNCTCSCGKKYRTYVYSFRKGKRCKECGNKKNIIGASLTQEQAFDRYKSFGYELKSKYKNCRSKDELICPAGHTIFMPLIQIMKGYGCLICSGKKKKTLEEINEYASKDGYKCISTEYINSFQKLDFLCPQNHVFSTQWNSFYSANVRCTVCSGFKKLEFDFIKLEIEKTGYKLLSKEYKNNQSILVVECPNNHIFETTWNRFNDNHRCAKCYHLSLMGENSFKWKKDRSRKRRCKYLRFYFKNIKILQDDINYEYYLTNKNLYEIDHIFPRKAFIDNNLDQLYNLKIIKAICNSRDNLQILLIEDNRNKNSKYNQEEFMNWFKSRPEYPELERLREEALVKEYINSR